MKKVFLLILVSGFCFFISGKALADSALYTANVSVDVTAENSAIARDKAMKEANRQALLSIAESITTPDGVQKFSDLNDAQILNFIKETSVVDEKTSPTRYLANLTVLINEDLVRAYMNEQEIPVVINETKSAIVIPVYKKTIGMEPELWEETNEWLKAWENKIVKKGLVSLRSISRNLEPYITAEQALQLDGISFEQISRQAGNDEIYVLEATTDATGNALNVTVTSYKDGKLDTVLAENFDDAISKSAGIINNSLKKESITQSYEKSEIIVMFSYDKLSEWVETQKTLKSISSINKINVDALGSGKVQFKMDITVTIQDLLKNLNLHNLSLEEYSGFYVLKKEINYEKQTDL